MAITTILFTDLVGSTALMQRAGDERARELVDAHRKALAEAVASSGGTELQWLGDGLMAAFASPADAVRSAIAMQRFPRARGSAPELVLRIGLDVGELLEQEQRGTGSGYFGTPVVIARRLCDLATGGQILCSSTVAGLLRGRAAFRFKELGAKTLKGMAEPELVFEIEFEQAAGPGPLPLPPLLASMERIALVGREAPLGRLRAALEATTGAGQRRASLIAGEPGIGKTRLAAELAFAAHTGGATVLFGRCDEDPLMPYQPFVEALRFAIANADTETLGRWVGRRGADLTRLVPELAERLPVGEPVRGDPDNDRARLFDAVIGFLENLSRDRPLVLVLDDLHWSDKPSLMLLMHLLRSAQPAPILVVGTYRETDLDRGHPLTEVLADLRRIEGYERVLLRGLDAAETEALMQSVSPHEATERTRGFARAVHAETEGNPFFLHEVVRNFKEAGTITERGGLWTSNLASFDQFEIPEGVREVVGRRLSRRSEGCQSVLGRAAVQGRDFDLGVLERVTDLSSDQVLDAIDEAIAAGLVEPLPEADRFRFAHALVRDMLYGELTTSRRIRAHRQVGEALEAMGAAKRPERRGELALHFLEAAPGGDVAKAVEYGLSVARQALDASAHEEAIAHCRRTLEVAESDGAISPATRAELLTVLGVSLLTLGQQEEAQAAIENVLALGDVVPPEIFAQAAMVSGQLATAKAWGVVDTLSTDLLVHAVDRLDHTAPDLAIEVICEITRGLLVAGAVGPARSWHEKATPMVAVATQHGTVIRHQIMASWLRFCSDEFTEAKTLAEEATRRAKATGDQSIILESLVVLSGLLQATGDLDQMVGTIERMRVAADATSNAVYQAIVATYRSGLAWVRGDMAGFAALLGIARRLCEPFPVAAQTGASQALYAAVDQGRIAEMDEDIERFIAPSRDIPNLRSSWVLFELNRGHGDAVRDTYERMAASGFTEMNQDFTWLYSRCSAAACVIAYADHDRADQAYAMILPLAHTNWSMPGGTLSHGSVSQQLGSLASLMERYDQAERHFEDALAMNTRMGHQPGLVKTRVEYAAMLMRRAGPGDWPRAAELARTAEAHAESLGFRPWVERASGIIAAAAG